MFVINRMLERQIKENMSMNQKKQLLDSRTRSDYIRKAREQKQLGELVKTYKMKSM